ncbi:MAG: TIGR04372 family glycosyltransferase [Vicinamibacterales bacterium]
MAEIGPGDSAGASLPPWEMVRSTHQGRPLIVSRPKATQYGHLALEIHLSLVYAMEAGAALYLLRERGAVNPALYEVESSAVAVLRPTVWQDAWLSARLMLPRWWRYWSERARGWRLDFYRALRNALAEHCIDPRVPDALRVRLRDIRQALNRWRAEEEGQALSAEFTYVERTKVRHPVESHLNPAASERARALAAEIGVTDGMRLVCVHAREAGYKRGREVNDKASGRDDSTRNARIETYFEAIDRLVAQGFTVVRVGDPSMEPVVRPGVIDLATHPKRSALAEVHCLYRSAFLICGESGPLSVSYLTNTPIVTVNSTDPIGGYPMRRDGFYILKGVVDRRTGLRLRAGELLTEGYLRHLRDTKRFVYVENTPDEICAVVDEMLEWLDGAHAESPAQVQFRDAATRASVELRDRLGYVRKHGSDRGFLGDGRIGRRYIEEYA